MNNLKIAIVGSTSFTEETIRIFKRKKIKIEFIITKKKDNINTDYVDLKRKFKNIKTIYDKNLDKKSTINLLKKSNLDFILCIGWSHIINLNVINLTKHGVIGHHPTLLPSNRGKHPLIWSKFLGLKNFGSTFFFLTELIDSGAILVQQKINIKNSDSSTQMFKKLYKVLDKQIHFLIKNFFKIIKNSKKMRKNGNYWRKRYYFDGKIDFRMTAQAIDRLVKALSYPYAGSHVEIGNSNFKVFNSKIIKNKELNLIPGKILKIKKKSLTVKCYIDAIEIFNERLSTYCKKKKYLY